MTASSRDPNTAGPRPEPNPDQVIRLNGELSASDRITPEQFNKATALAEEFLGPAQYTGRVSSAILGTLLSNAAVNLSAEAARHSANGSIPEFFNFCEQNGYKIPCKAGWVGETIDWLREQHGSSAPAPLNLMNLVVGEWSFASKLDLAITFDHLRVNEVRDRFDRSIDKLAPIKDGKMAQFLNNSAGMLIDVMRYVAPEKELTDWARETRAKLDHERHASFCAALDRIS